MLIRLKNNGDNTVYTYRTIPKYLYWDNKDFALENRLIFFEKESKEELIKFNINYIFKIFCFSFDRGIIHIAFEKKDIDIPDYSANEIRILSFKPHCLYSWGRIYSDHQLRINKAYFINGIEIDQKDFVKGVKNYKIKRFTKNNI